MDTGVIVVLTTVGSEEQGELIATKLVEENLAACVNIAPSVKSVYRWKGELTHDEEWLLIVKTTAAHFEAVRRRIKSLHLYDLPEIIALPVTEGDDAVLDWVRGAVSPSADG